MSEQLKVCAHNTVERQTDPEHGEFWLCADCGCAEFVPYRPTPWWWDYGIGLVWMGLALRRADEQNTLDS